MDAQRVDVSLTLRNLPCSIAEEIEQVQQSDPERMQRIVMYGMARSAIFETLLDELSPVSQ